ncbi:hypothetical protein EJO66_22770 [Variovorax beijingensis]|uniref:Uncharacterized protein n=1 Tax=Variovorax beijingensis TaxID=2496117 RepID=A0ABY0A2N1_9BURK|nr:hypothetical protein [Variovorax beijingensis]RSZ32067.1 hypothetical protein EJO66_22770 [Variovorax beijingensis]
MNNRRELQHGHLKHATREPAHSKAHPAAPASGPFLNCSCGLAHLERIHRRWWMKLFPWLRFYCCSRCGKSQLASKRAVSFAITSLRSGGETAQMPVR